MGCHLWKEREKMEDKEGRGGKQVVEEKKKEKGELKSDLHPGQESGAQVLV